MEKWCKQFLDRYANDSFYWYQPKGFTISVSNLPLIQRKLKLVRRFTGRRWSKVQEPFTRSLQRAGLFQPQKAQRGSRDFSAIARMNKEVFDSLGVAWITAESIVEITDAGRDFLGRSESDLAAFVSHQQCRYQYPNPCVGRSSPNASLFPLPTILAILTSVPAGVPRECFELFISRVRNDEDIPWATEHIER